MKHQQLGGTFAGILIGLVIGLGIAIAVALAVSKMPVPFLNTGANTRPATLDAAEAERNRTWNPNASLAGSRGPAAPANNTVPAQGNASQPAAEPASEVVAVAPASVPGSDPLGELAAQVSRPSSGAAAPAATPAAGGAGDAYLYFVQAGAFRSQADADAQRARLAMLGWDARVTQRAQQGQAVYRVRVGPFNRSEDAANLKRQLDGQGMDSAVVRQAR